MPSYNPGRQSPSWAGRCSSPFLPPDVAVAVWDSENEPSLYPEEALSIEGVVESRRAEFGRGRSCARKALAELGLPPQPISVGSHRQPGWPLGVVGSITHCEGLAVAVAAMASELLAVGLDAELANPLPSSTRPMILHASEMFTDTDRPLLETVVFSAKESIDLAFGKPPYQPGSVRKIR